MRRYLIIGLLLLCCIGNYSQEKDYSKIDQYVDSISQKKYKSFEELVKQFNKPKWTEIQKVRAVYYWIASNIDYDKQGYETGAWRSYKFDNSLATETYKQRKGVCSGYSTLFKYMCNQLGIEAEVIGGYSKKDNAPTTSIEIPNHAWNAVKLNKQWYLIDVTWTRIAEEDRKYDNFYFLAKPEELITNHYPEDPKWQLLNKPVSKKEFDNYPFISSAYFELGFNKDFPKKGLLYAEGNKVEFSIETLNNYTVLLKIYNDEAEKWVTPDYKVLKNKDDINITVNLKEEGNYLLKVDVLLNDSTQYEMYRGVLYFTLMN